jgi:TPR repeat protein
MKRSVLSILAIVVGLAALPVAASEFEAGMVAYRGGDYAEALARWRPLAEAGMAEAQFNLGLMYRLGKGLEQDDVQAANWYRGAADQGIAGAQFNLGDMYEKGLGVEQYDIHAHFWFHLAKDFNFPGAKKRLRQVADRLDHREIALSDLMYRQWKSKYKARP